MIIIVVIIIMIIIMMVTMKDDVSKFWYRTSSMIAVKLPPGGVTPIYGLYRYVPWNRVSFLRFSVLK